MKYEKLLTPGRIGPLTLKNRGVMMPMGTDLADTNGCPTPRQIAYYQERAKGGVAMIINEYTGVDDVDSIPSIHNLRAARDYHTNALEELTDAVHTYDCKIIAQLHHGGATSNPAFTGRDNLAPSAVPIADGRPVPKEMTLEDIQRVQQKFVDAALRCKKAGYDGVELHGAHGYLIAQFFSKYYNRRTDAYGGSAENRARFVTEIIAQIRARLGRYPILVRMCGDEMTPVEGFLGLDEGLEIAKVLEQAGIDAINISMGSARNGDANCEPFSYVSGWKKHVAAAYRQALSIPVIATNTIKDPDFAESLLEEGVCDFVGLGRSQLADPDFMNKAANDQADEIRRCIGCLYCRERVLGGAQPIRCAINARTAREIEFPEIPQDGAGRTAVVIGGGPAGMEAARVLALRGFAVSLYERAERLGGTLNIADQPPFKEKLTQLVQTMETQIRHLGVKIHTGKEAAPEEIQALSPAAVILAIGADPVIPPLPGVDGSQVCLAEDVLLEKVKPSGKVVIIGSGLTGIETAEVLLAEKDARGIQSVDIVEMLPEIGPGIFPAIRNDELSRVTPHNPGLYPGHKLLSIQPGTVSLERTEDGAAVELAADRVVLALGVRPRGAIAQLFQEALGGAKAPDGKRIPVLTCGDARQGGRIGTAIRQGFEVGFTVLR